MPKGYSKEMMEAFFREEQSQKQKEEEIKKAKKQSQLEAIKKELSATQTDALEKKLEELEKKLFRLKIWVVVSVILAVIAVSFAANDSLKELMLLLP